jgi:single-strand DNA-binding protein
MNQVVLVGNLTDDPQLRYTKSGRAVANFTVAVSHREHHNGRSQDVTDGFFAVTCWRDLAEHAAESFKKGSRVLVGGRLIQRSWETEDGSKRTSVEITANHVGAELTFAVAEISKPSAGESPQPAEQG